MTLKDQVAVVTGAGTGIGKGIALALAAAGASVVVDYWENPADADDTVRQIREGGGEGLPYEADVSDRASVEALAETAVHTYGDLHIWVNNAARQPNLGLFDYDQALYRQVLATNLKGYLFGIQAAACWMKPRGYGRIVNISSVHGKRPTDFDVVYAMSKGGIKMLVREAAIELGHFGITVNTIEPGAVRVGPKSGQVRPIGPPAGTSPGPTAQSPSRFPLGRIGLPADIGRIAVFLASPDSEFISGAAIRADGASMLL